MPLPNGDVPFVSRSLFEGAAGGFESASEASDPSPKPPKESPPSGTQKARANDLFLRGVLTPEPPARAKADRSGFDAIIGKSNFLPTVFLEIGASTSRSTRLVRTAVVNLLGRSGAWSGTGLLIARNITTSASPRPFLSSAFSTRESSSPLSPPTWNGSRVESCA